MSLVHPTLADLNDADEAYRQMEKDIEESPELSRLYGWPPENPPMPEDLDAKEPEWVKDLPF